MKGSTNSSKIGSITPNSSMKSSTYTNRTITVCLRPQQCSEHRRRCCAHINICVSVNCKIKGILHADSTTEKASKKTQRSLNSSMWRRGDITVTKILPSVVRRALVQQCAYARSKVCVQRRASVQQWRLLEQWRGVMSAATTRLSGCGRVTSTAKAPTCVCPMLL